MKKILFLITFLLLTKICLAEIPIYCPHCKTHLYNYQKDEIKINEDLKAENFKPVDETIPQPKEEDRMVCPLDDCPLNQYESWAWERKLSPPVFKVWAISFLTKDEKGDWIGVPYDVKFEDWEGKH